MPDGLALSYNVMYAIVGGLLPFALGYATSYISISRFVHRFYRRDEYYGWFVFLSSTRIQTTEPSDLIALYTLAVNVTDDVNATIDSI